MSFPQTNTVKVLFGDAGSGFMLLFKISYYFSIIAINTKCYFRWCYQPCRQFETIKVRSAQTWRLNKSVEGAFVISDERENTSPIVSSANPDASVITEISSVQSVAQRCVQGTTPARPTFTFSGSVGNIVKHLIRSQIVMWKLGAEGGGIWGQDFR